MGFWRLIKFAGTSAAKELLIWRSDCMTMLDAASLLVVGPGAEAPHCYIHLSNLQFVHLGRAVSLVLTEDSLQKQPRHHQVLGVVVHAFLDCVALDEYASGAETLCFHVGGGKKSLFCNFPGNKYHKNKGLWSLKHK